MRSTGLTVLLLGVIVIALSACALPPHYNVLENGQVVPPEQTLLIAKFQLDPYLEQGDLPIYMGTAARKRGEMFVMIYPDRNIPYDQGAMMPLPLADAISANINFIDTSFLPLPTGSKFIRYGTVDQAVTGMYDGRTMTTTSQTLDLMGDVEIDLPQNTKAVYAGTITWHYEKGKISVKDEYETALRDLDKAKVPGITSKSVVKKLAKVHPPNLK
jgi:hypothetical protein